MEIDLKLLDQIHQAGGKVVAVTKYLSPEQMEKVQAVLLAHPAVLGLGENRSQSVAEKIIPREACHFVGRLQSRQLPLIVEHCEVIHSVDQLKYATKIHQISEGIGFLSKIFVQINVSQEAQKGGLDPETLPAFLREVKKFKSLEVVGLSAIGAGEFTTEQKVAEFALLKNLRDQHLPLGLISAGTSRDYDIALEQGIDIVRIGRALF